jgi:WD40 repeat protein
VLDLSWHDNSQLLLSCSFDKKVILWKLAEDERRTLPLIIFEHSDVPSQVCFNQDFFATGSLEGKLRCFKIDKK